MQKSVAKGKKRCRRCGSVKPLSEFSRNKRTPDGRQIYCKMCCKEIRAGITLPSTKKCCRCDTKKPLSEFRYDKHSPDGRKDYCMLCGKKPVMMPCKYEGELLNTWEQAESVIREIAELQVAIDVEKSKCQERIKMIESYTDELIAPEIARITYLENMLKDFCKRERISGPATKRDLRFGSIAFRKGVFSVSLDKKLAMARMGKP
jgi:hypothetical protein